MLQGITPLRISASSLNAFERCELRYALDYVQRLPDSARDPAPELGFGTAVHMAIARFFRLGGWTRRTKDDLMAYFEEAWAAIAPSYPSEDIEVEQYARAVEMLSLFHDNHYPSPSAIQRELGVERFLTWHRPRRGLVATGRVDRACWMEGSTLELIDYKTSEKPLSQERLEREHQVVLYRSLGAERYTHLAPERVIVTFVYLPSMTAVTAELTRETFLARWEHIERLTGFIRKSLARHHAGATLAEAFPPNRGAQCRNCPVRSVCQRMTAMEASKVPTITLLPAREEVRP